MVTQREHLQKKFKKCYLKCGNFKNIPFKIINLIETAKATATETKKTSWKCIYMQ